MNQLKIQTFNPNFKKLLVHNSIIGNRKSNDIKEGIIEKLQQENKKGFNYVQNAEKNGYDIYLNPNEEDYSVKVDLVKRNASQKHIFDGKPIKKSSVKNIGIYSNAEDFNAEWLNQYFQQLKETKQAIKTTLKYMIAVVLAVGAGITYNIKFMKPSSSLTTKPNQTILNDTVTKTLKDSLNLVK